MDEFLTITEASRLIAARALSPIDLTQHCLARIRRLDPVLHSFIAVTEERALRDARAAEARVMAGTGRGKLDGIPIAHKDIYCTAGIATTAHSKQLQGYIPDEDAATVRKLAEAGTVLLGKLATHEFAFGGPAFDLPWPPARNPWNPEHFTGGSSSGTAAAVAAGLILGGTGSDTAGSIRAPAALCGITGIKPTYGLCSRVGILPLAFSMDHAGPLAWTVEDCALLLHAMAGPDHSDRASAGRVAPDYTATLNDGVKGMRIGVVRHFYESDHPVSEGARKGVDSAIDIFRRLGAEVREVQLPPLADYSACGWLILLTEAFAVHERWIQRSVAPTTCRR
jgi:aspartyl-tRNA(Asn)/glutamyl-tRNA(Gln) amidotransferase subunit A